MTKKPIAYIFGAGATGRALLPLVEEKYQVAGFLDNDPSKWQTEVSSMTVHNPLSIHELPFDMIVLGTYVGLDPMTEQLLGMGINRTKIDHEYISLTVKARVMFLEKLGQMFHANETPGCVAEGGVFQGDFAKEINRVFPTKRMYLFDTFAGFDERDVAYESAKQYSESNAGHFNITSEEMVLAKLKHPEMCVIRKGYFPQTTQGIDEKFCFVNLDFDLYQPILAGLEYFSPRMVKGGVILIHEYFSEYYKGVMEAVKTYEKQNGELNLFPIGDGLSIGILF